MADEPGFTAASSRLRLPAIDREVLALWRERDVFRRSLAGTAHGPAWVFYEGPPTANGRPGTHHVEARAFKDVFPRYKTMKGFHVLRRAGWDCHGLPVEIAVERELGLSGKQDIERVGVAEFNARCRESVQRHVAEFEAVTERLGYWVDTSQAYRTMAPEYIESVWWAIKQIHGRGLLAEDYRVAPYCPRCGTALSEHEVAQGYETVGDPSAYVRLPVLGDVAGIEGVDLLIWTTTPWTLVANTAVAVHPDLAYAVVRTPDGTFVVAETLVRELPGAVEVLATLPGARLDGLRYRPPLDLVPVPGAHRVILAGYVTAQDGTGLVHQAPAFGADDLAACRRYGLPVVNPVGPDGRFHAGIDVVGGLFFKDADPVLIAELRRRGLLLRHVAYEHQYPHCWRCHTPLLYYAQLSWYIRTTAIRDRLLACNERTTWYPEHIKHGRFGDWLSGNVDWALSRNRYWGTPLPLWRCGQGHVTCVASRAELGDLAGRDLSGLDPHRPYIDEVTFACPGCGTTAVRVPEVADAWLDSGSMPFAQLGYPLRPGSAEQFAGAYPAQFIAEAIDQTRGWFYTLMAIGVLLFDAAPYENVVCLGHIVAADGRKMSKHLGNVLEPLPLMDRHGADSLRWFMLCSGSPWNARRVAESSLDEIVRRVLVALWNSVSFFTLYAQLSGWRPAPAGDGPPPSVLDRWLRAELHHLVAEVDAALADFDTAGAGRALAQFVEDLSNWYVRLSRPRFWSGDPAALAALYETIDVLARLMAPFVPFITEHIWQVAVRPGDPAAPDSVHLATWPECDRGLLDDDLRRQMAAVRSIVEAGRSARREANIRVRQPLSRLLFSMPDGSRIGDGLLGYVRDELNVREAAAIDGAAFDGTAFDGAAEIVDVSVKPNFRELGRRFGPRTQQVAAAIRGADPGGLSAALSRDGRAMLAMSDGTVEVSADEVVVTRMPRAGWAIGSQRGVVVAIDTTVTPELLLAGLAREVVRLVQEARKQRGLAVADRIALVWAANGDTAAALRRHRDELAAAVLAVDVSEGEPAADAAVVDGDLGLRFAIAPVPR